MFLHIGGNVTVPVESIIAIMDIDNTTISRDTREFLKVAEEEGFVESIKDDLPKTFIVSEYEKKSKVYLTPISSITLQKRAKQLERLAKGKNNRNKTMEQGEKKNG